MQQQTQFPPQLLGIISVLAGSTLGFMALRGFLLLIPFQPPEGVGPVSGNSYNVWVSTLPTAAYLYILGCFLAGAFLGAACTTWITKNTRYTIAPLMTGFIIVILCIGQFLAFTHPEWMTYAACIGIMIAAWLGGVLVRSI